MALRELPMSGGTTVTVKYQHTDALGAPVAVTDAAKAIVETFEYEPYGQLVNSTLKDGPGFTGHVQDAATGLTYMQQRYYDPQVGLFLSVDPVTAYSNPVGMFNRYRHGNSNPYRFPDPDGRFACGSTAHCRDEIRGLEQRGIFPVQAKGDSSAKAKIDCVECNEVQATRAGIMRDGGERLQEAGKFAGWMAVREFGAGLLGRMGKLGSFLGLSRKEISFGAKIEGQMGKRGWSKEMVGEAVNNPARTVATRDTRHLPGGGRMNDPATAYYHRDGGYVVRNDRTGDVVQVSDRADSGWIAPWD